MRALAPTETARPARRPAWRPGAILLAAAGSLLLGACQPQKAFGTTAAGAPSSAPATADYVWRPVAIGGGGFITGYATDARGVTRVIRTDVYGAYVWRPASNRWVQLVTAASMPADERAPMRLNEGVYAIAVAPSDPNRIYMALKGGVYRSRDAGASFVRTQPGARPLRFDPNSEFRLFGPFMAVSPGDPDLVLFGSPEDGLWRTADGGASWTRIASAPAARDLRPASGVQAPGVGVWFGPPASPRTRGRIWAMSPGNGFFESTDAGRSFHPLGAGGPLLVNQGAFAADGAFYAVDGEHQAVWKYADGAWRNLAEARGLTPARFTAIAVNPQGPEIIVFDEGGAPQLSRDGGASWRPLLHRAQVGAGDPPWLRVADQAYFATGPVRFDPVVRNRLWAATGTGVYVADLGASAEGLVWTSQTRGVEELVANDVVSAPGQAPLFAAWDFGIHRKTDLDAFSTGYGPKERVLIAAQSLDWSAAHPDFVVTNASDTRMTCCWQDGDAVLAGYSEDGGRTWRKFASLPQPPGTRADDPWRMSFGTIAVAADDPDDIVWLPSFDRSPYYTLDRGRSWERVRLAGEVLPFTGSHGAYTYTRRTLAADRVLPHVFYLVHSGTGANLALRGLWRTEDGGVSWRKVFNGEIAPQSEFSAKLRAAPGQAGHLFFTSGVFGAADTDLRRSNDGGATWTRVSGVNDVSDIGFGRPAPGAASPAIFLVGRFRGDYGVWRSLDDAAHWTKVGQFPVGDLDQVVAVEGDKNVFGRVYLGFTGSGWAYGQPSTCATAAVQPGVAECFVIQDAPKMADRPPSGRTAASASASAPERTPPRGAS
jgi:photosystem II stability/assembly factor-like uncharacterized protein